MNQRKPPLSGNTTLAVEDKHLTEITEAFLEMFRLMQISQHEGAQIAIKLAAYMTAFTEVEDQRENLRDVMHNFYDELIDNIVISLKRMEDK